MSNNNNNSGGFLAVLGNAILLAIIFMIAGFTFHVAWLLVKIPLWIISPYRGGLETTEEDVMMISFRRMMWTPYSLRMILFSGISIIFSWAFIIAIGDPGSLVYSEDKSALYLLLTIIGVSSIITLSMMIIELRMIFSFEGWFKNMVRDNRNPLT